jgi:hypothetical protein
MKKLIALISILSSLSSIASEEMKIDHLNILSSSDVDAVCISLKGAESYAISHEFEFDTLEDEVSPWEYIGKKVSDSAQYIYNALDPMCNNQQACNQRSQIQGKTSNVYSKYDLNEAGSSFVVEYIKQYAPKYSSSETEIISVIECN